MDLIVDGILKAFRLILSLAPEVMGITLLSLRISGTATLISMALGIAASLAIALNEFPGKRLCISIVNTGMGMPPVVVGLVVTVMLWRSGPFGFLEVLYTPTAIVIAQVLIACPIVTAIALGVVLLLLAFLVNLALTRIQQRERPR